MNTLHEDSPEVPPEPPVAKRQLRVSRVILGILVFVTVFSAVTVWRYNRHRGAREYQARYREQVGIAWRKMRVFKSKEKVLVVELEAASTEEDRFRIQEEIFDLRDDFVDDMESMFSERFRPPGTVRRTARTPQMPVVSPVKEAGE